MPELIIDVEGLDHLNESEAKHEIKLGPQYSKYDLEELQAMA